MRKTYKRCLKVAIFLDIGENILRAFQFHKRGSRDAKDNNTIKLKREEYEE